jgi:hypothetical protein
VPDAESDDELGPEEKFAKAIDAGDSSCLFERLHPAVKATYEDAMCRVYIGDRVLLEDESLQVGPVIWSNRFRVRRIPYHLLRSTGLLRDRC